MAELAQQLQAILQQGSARLKQPLPLPDRRYDAEREVVGGRDMRHIRPG